MIVELRFNKKEMDELLKSVEVVCDTREQRNENILEYFDARKIPYRTEKLEYGDYTAVLPANKELGIDRDIYFSNRITIERKNSVDELIQNLTKERVRLENEFIRAGGSKLYLMLENAKYSDVVSQKYRSKMSPQALLGNIKTFEARYNIDTVFIDDSKFSGNFIAHTLKYHVREFLKEN